MSRTSAGKWWGGYLSYMMVGGGLGVVSWALQIAFKLLLSGFDMRIELLEAVAVVMAFVLMGLVGFLTHRRFVFRSQGSLARFYIAGACIILSVAVLTAMIVALLTGLGATSFSVFAYPSAAILVSPVSYVFKKHWVYDSGDPRPNPRPSQRH